MQDKDQDIRFSHFLSQNLKSKSQTKENKKVISPLLTIREIFDKVGSGDPDV